MDAKILLFDIETSDLKADFGTVLCVGYKWLAEDTVYVPSIMDYKGWKKNLIDDSRLLRDVYKVLVEADMWVTYYGKGFDVKYLNSKFLEHGIPILPNTPHVDLFFVAKANLAISRKSLQNVSYYLQTDSKKSPVEGRIWKRAQVGDEEALGYVKEHCHYDVLVLEETYLKLRPLVRTHPRVSGFDPCRVCGGTKLQKRGPALTVLRGPRQRYYCTSCGAWENRPVSNGAYDAENTKATA